MKKLMNLYKAKPDAKRTNMLVSGYLMTYIITDDIKYAKEALLFIDAQKCTDMPVKLFAAYFNIIAGNYKKAEEKFSYFAYYKKYIKYNMPEIYSFYVFLKALRENFKNDRYMRELSSLGCNTDFFKAYISIYEENDMSDVYNYIINCKNKSSIFYYAVIFTYCIKKNKIIKDNNIVLNFIKWAVNHDINISEFLENNKKYISLGIFDNEFACRLYNIYESDFLLGQLCRISMLNFDYGLRAYEFYREAVRRRLKTEGINKALIISSYKCGKKDISPQCVSEYLSSDPKNDEIRAYIYYLIINNNEFKALLSKYSSDIKKFTVESIEKGIKGKYYYALYCCYYVNSFGIDSSRLDMIERMLSRKIFVYEIKSKRAGYIWIRDKFHSEIKKYEMKGGKAFIRSADKNFSCYLFSKASKEIIMESAETERLIPSVTAKFVYMLFLRGICDDDILYCLSEYIIKNPIYDFRNILEKTLEIKGCAPEFKYEIYSALGKIYFQNNEYERAAFYYKKLNIISDDEASYAAEAFINAGDIKKAAEICLENKAHISDEILFAAARLIDEEFDDKFAQIYYELLMKSYYDIKFVKAVIKCYNISVEDLIILRKALKGTDTAELDYFIISQCLNMRIFNEDVQEIFCSLYKNNNSKNLDDFIDFCCYNIIVENKKINLNLAKCLEYEALKTKKIEILAALGYIYVGDKSKSIMGVVIEETKKRKISFPFLNKNGRIKTFMHKSLPESNVYFCYKTQDTEDLIKMKATYFRYGIFMASIKIFQGDVIEYYFSDDNNDGLKEIKTEVCNDTEIISGGDISDKINNAIIYRQTNRNTYAEGIIRELESDIILKCSII